jgi:transketolase
MTQFDSLCVNSIRILSMDAVQKANSGHPGMPMGMADVAYVLWSRFLRHNPANPNWYDRDRFILSAGHGSMLLYSLLHLTGYGLSLDEIRQFRQMGSRTPGHPEYGITPGVELTTGPLGQGFATGVGMAMAANVMVARFNKPDMKLTNHYVYAIVSDGDLMEGISHEAASLAGHLGLSNLIYLYDSNRITIDGSTDLTLSDNPVQRFEGLGWDVQVVDGHDHEEIAGAIERAQQSDKPSLIECRTTIGFGSPNKQGSESSHGAPLGEEEIQATRKALGWEYPEPFDLPEDVAAWREESLKRGDVAESEWNAMMSHYRELYPEDAKAFQKALHRELPPTSEWEQILPNFEPSEKGMATRKASGMVLNAIKDHIPTLTGGSADLTGSNVTYLEGEGNLSSDNFTARNIHYGVREHAMAAAINGMNLHGGVIPYGGTFLVFSDYNKPAIRIAALCEIPSLFVFSHDSIGLGEDGPTHQPIEHLAALRATPNVQVFRPADANEVAWCWKAAIQHQTGPSVMVLTRQSLPTLDRNGLGDASESERGAYILKKEQGNHPDLIILATGSEVYLGLMALEELRTEGIDARLVSMPCIERFEEQSTSYREEVLPPEVKKRISVEAGSTFGWHRWVGTDGITIGIDRFGISAPFNEVYEKLGVTTERIIQSARELMGSANRRG